MSSRCSSAPKMRQIYTPRVKDGRRSNDQSPQKQKYQSAPKVNLVEQFNPEKHEQFEQKKKVHHERVQNILNQKTKLEAKESNMEKIVNQKLLQKDQLKINEKNNQQTIYGRKLEYPLPSNNYNLQENTSDAQLDLRKSSSLSSQHFVDRSIKSAEIKSRKSEFDSKFQQAFGYLLDNNKAYLNERRRACNQKARPKDQIFKVLRPQITTTNKDQYPQKNAPYEFEIEPQNQKTALGLGPRKVCGNSTSQEFHKGNMGPRADLAKWPEGFKLEGPMDSTTTYANKFPNHGNFEKMVPIAKFNEHPSGMPHKTNSTHRTFFKGGYVPPTDLATWKNLHPYGNAFDPNRGTTYSQKHGSKEIYPTQQWPMNDPRLITSDGKFTTEYRTNNIDFNAHDINAENYCRCSRKPHVH